MAADRTGRPLGPHRRLSCGTLIGVYVPEIWICHTPKICGFVVLLARVEARIETIEIAVYGSFFAVLTLSRYVNSSTVGAGVRQ
jgi:hypothetical protein